MAPKDILSKGVQHCIRDIQSLDPELAGAGILAGGSKDGYAPDYRPRLVLPMRRAGGWTVHKGVHHGE